MTLSPHTAVAVAFALGAALVLNVLVPVVVLTWEWEKRGGVMSQPIVITTASMSSDATVEIRSMKGGMMEYDIIEATSRQDLVDFVNDACRAGWVPQGGVCCMMIGHTVWHFQAVVKHRPSYDGAYLVAIPPDKVDCEDV